MIISVFVALAFYVKMFDGNDKGEELNCQAKLNNLINTVYERKKAIANDINEKFQAIHDNPDLTSDQKREEENKLILQLRDIYFITNDDVENHRQISRQCEDNSHLNE